MQGRVKIVYFNYLLEKLQTRINGWMKNLLSMAGRLTLVNSVLMAVGTHVMA